MRSFIALLLGLALAASAQTRSLPAAPARHPKLILAIIVDQFRYDYLTRFRGRYTGGIARMLKEGAVLTSAYFEHFPTVTAVGHSTFLSGATPSISGIIGNEWYDRDAGRQVTSVFDDKVSMLGGVARGSGGGAASPRRLLVSTLGDELKMAGRGSKVIGISVKDRGAILPAGRMADGAYWFDPTSGNFVSSTWYFERLPAWVADFNQSRKADQFTGKTWSPLGGGEAFRTMPDRPGVPYYNLLESTPYGNELLVSFAQAAIAGEQLGQRDATDILALSFSPNDYIGHGFGPDDPRVEDVSVRTDRLLGEFFQYLEARIGMRHILVVFTSDHGVAPVPEVSQQRRMPGGRISEQAPADAVEKRLTARYGEGKWVIGRTGASLYLNHAWIEEKRLDLREVAETAAAAVREIPNVFRVYTRDQLVRGAVPGDLFDRRILAGFHQRRSPDLTILADPYYLFESRGTSHGAPFHYDAHIPLLFLGGWIKAGVYPFPVAANDIAPTLAALLEVEIPSGATGRVLHEVLQTPPAAAARMR